MNGPGFTHLCSRGRAWSYGNFLLREGDEASGFAQINHAVQADPSLALPAVSQAWHKTQDANVLLNQVLPATQDAYFQAIDFMAANGQPAGALVIWERLLTLGKSVGLRRSFPLLEFCYHFHGRWPWNDMPRPRIRRRANASSPMRVGAG